MQRPPLELSEERFDLAQALEAVAASARSR
jgi:hypothetical protein